LWSLQIADIDFAVRVFEKSPQLATRTRLFITGTGEKTIETALDDLRVQGVTIAVRRLEESDVAFLQRPNTEHTEDASQQEEQTQQIHVCAGKQLTLLLQEWMRKLDLEIVAEDFAY